MSKLEQLQKAKETLCIERDRLADLYTNYIQQLLKYENEPEVYNEYIRKIEELEPETNQTKERMRELNREIAKVKNEQSL